MRKDLLNLLADRLEQVRDNPDPKKLFNMNFWRLAPLHPDATRDCGTVQCAIGFAAEIPEFAAAGLTVVRDEDWGRRCHLELNGVEDNSMRMLSGIFEFPEHLALQLFFVGSYAPGPASLDRVIARLRYVAEHGKIQCGT